jgi:predicted DNA-binding transcriptional regulator YafY
LSRKKDGSGILEGHISKNDLTFFADYFIGLGRDVQVKKPATLVRNIKVKLKDLSEMYDKHNFFNNDKK